MPPVREALPWRHFYGGGQQPCPLLGRSGRWPAESLVGRRPGGAARSIRSRERLCPREFSESCE